MPTKRDYYEILGVTKTASADEIKSAYRKMALKFHPDRNKAKDAEEKFKEINEAYQILSDPQKKQTYDQFGHAAFDPASGMGGNPFSGGFRTGGPFTWSYTGSSQPFGNGDFGDPFEIFESFFGGGFGGGPRRPRYELQIDFMEAVRGVEKDVYIENKKHHIKVPAGANDGTRLRFDEFDISIDVRPHPQFRRDGDDLYVDTFVSYPTATLGGTIEVPTIEGTLKLKVRAGTPSHSLIRLRGEGVQRLQGRGKGDLYVRVVVRVPEKVSNEEKKLLEQLQKISK